MGKHHNEPIGFDKSLPGVKEYWDTKQQYMKFEASIEEVDGEWYRLDKNLFYPEGGGQPGDTGVLKIGKKQIKVCDTQIKDGKVWLEVEQSKFKEGEVVLGIIDESRRLILSRNHSGQHLLSAAFYSLFEADTVRAELRIDENQIDLDKKMGIADVTKAFDLSIEQISENLDISTKVLSKTDLKKFNLRGDLAKVGESGIFRMVQIGDESDPFDRNLCGGTHVGSTSEILSLSLSKLEGKKVRFRSGLSSLEELTRRNELTLELQREINTQEQNILPNVRKMIEDQVENVRKMRKMSAELHYYRFNSLPWIDGEGVRYKIMDQIEGDRSQLGRIFDELKEEEILIARFISGVIAIASGDERNTKYAFDKLKSQGMKGGGKGKILMGKGESIDLDKMKF